MSLLQEFRLGRTRVAFWNSPDVPVANHPGFPSESPPGVSYRNPSRFISGNLAEVSPENSQGVPCVHP